MDKIECHYCKSHPAQKFCREKMCARYNPEEWLFQQITVHPNGCWLITKCLDEHGYARLGVRPNRVYAHRISYEIFKGEIPEGLMCLHRCSDMRNCVNPLHLRPGTAQDNVDDIFKDGHKKKWKPQETNLAKLNNAQVIEIKTRLETETVAAIARSFGMAYKTIWNIKHNRAWKLSIDELQKEA